MIDSVTGKKLVVQLDVDFGPYIQITNYQDAGAVEDVLDEMTIPYFTGHFEGAIDAGGETIFFGLVADPIKVQSVLDEMSFN